MTTLRIGLYARLPSDSDPATEEAQLDRLRSVAAEQGGTVVREYVELPSGPAHELEELLTDARAGAFDLVLCASLQEFARGGVAKAVRLLVQLQRGGVAFVSVAEPELCTLPGAEGSWVAALEVLAAHGARYRSRQVRAGIRQSRHYGRSGGRPRIPAAVRRKILRLRQEEGKSVRATADELGISRGTVTKYQDRPVDDLFEILPLRASDD